MKKLVGLVALAALTFGQSMAAHALDGSVSVGTTGDGGMVYRLGLQSDWDKSWLQSSTGRLTGYWDGGYTYWGSSSHGPSNNTLSFAPVFRYEFDGGSVKPFVEAGIGVAFFSSLEVGDNKLGTSFNFEDRVGFGLRFAGNQEVSVRGIHYSNGGIREPNDGIEAYSLNYRMPLNF
ncbi:acyloxyacyl hydrolase [Pseudomonas eucalypticola]|uniref:Lipid A deacylase n=1 Tax=Pseudomonas eucalypticola TaxID=2599595 RepID=A0A7D5D561_9PSED|nr:acyloxyacyl hydrolase [Pseudomonas eucalypticola]QKZ03096.1 acyloxyacyl hydrolase [Pseudomonas eucalypticola]